MNFIPIVGTNQLAKLRDGVIAAGTITYLTGFLVVASYSTWKGFGLTKVLDSQYIVAGLLPAFVLFVILQLLWASKQIVDKLRADILDRYSKRKLQLDSVKAGRRLHLALPLSATSVLFQSPLFVATAWVFFIGGALSMLGHVISGATVRNVALGVSIVSSTALGMGSVGISFALINLANDLKSDRGVTPLSTRLIWILYLLMSLFILGVALTTMANIYVKEIFPRVPIEFGGAAPRCVLLAAKDGFLDDKADKEDGMFKLKLQLPSDPYVFSDEKGHIWQLARDQVLAMRSCKKP